jgi:hypothetical protein
MDFFADGLFEIRNKVAQQQYALKSAVVKEEVEEHQQKMVGAKRTSDDNISLQRYDLLQS